MKTPEVRGKYWTVLATLAVIALGFMYYFFVIIKENEQLFNQTCFRNLDRVSKNFYDKHNSFTSNADEALKLALVECCDSSQEFQEEKFFNQLDSLLISVKKQNKINELLHYTNSIKRGELKNRKDKLTFFGSLQSAEIAKMKGYKIQKCENLNIDTNNITFTTTIEDFANPLFRSTVFEEYIIVRHLINKKKEKTEPLVYNSIFYDLPLTLPDSFLLKDKPTIKIGESIYHAYRCKVSPQKADVYFEVYGLVSHAKYEKAKYQLHSWFVTLLIVVLFILLLSIPIIKLFSLSPLEELSIKDFLFINFSVYVGIAIITLVVLCFFSNYTRNKVIDNNLDSIAVQVETKFKKGLKDASNELSNICDSEKNVHDSKQYFTNILDTCEQELPLKPYPTYLKPFILRDYFSFWEKADSFNIKWGTFLTGWYPINMSDSCEQDLSYTPRYLKNLKLAFLMDDSGNQKKVYSIFNKKGTFSQLGHRRYFNDAINDNHWQIKFNDEEEPSNLVIESIRSVSSGECLAAISRKYDCSKESSNNRPDSNIAVVALTTPFFEITNPVLPYGYEFLITDQKGDVWFHSTNDFNLQENFIDECNGHLRIGPAIELRSKLDFKCSYHEKKYRGKVVPIEGIPLTLITLYDTSISNSFRSQVLSFSFILVLLSFLILAFQVLMLLACYSKTDTFYSLNWLKFTFIKENVKNNANLYAKVSRTNISVIIFLVLFNLIMNLTGNNRVYLGLITTIISSIACFAYNFYILSENKVVVFRINWLRRPDVLIVNRKFLFALLSFLMVLVISLCSSAIYREVLFADIIIFMLLLFLIIAISNNRRVNVQTNGLKAYFRIYSSWLVLIGTLPAFFALSSTYKIEKAFQNNYYAYNFDKNIQLKSKQIDRFYNLLKHDPKQLKENQKEQIIYSEGLSKSTDISPIKLKDAITGIIPCFNSEIKRYRLLGKEEPCLGIPLNDASNFNKLTNNLYPLENSPEKWLWLLLFAILVVILLLFTILLKVLLKKTFGISLLPPTINENLSDFHIDSEKHNYFIIGLSGSQKDSLFKYTSTNAHVFHVKYIADEYKWKKELEKLDKSYRKTILIEDFEYGIKNIDFWDKKLKLLNSLYKIANKKVIVLSQIHPEQILKEYDYLAEVHKNSDKEKETTKDIYAKYYEWQQVLDRYIVHYKPLDNKLINDVLGVKEQKKKLLQMSVLLTLKHDKGLFYYADQEEQECLVIGIPARKAKNIEIEIDRQEYIENFHKAAFASKHDMLYNYYFSVWKSLPIEEKYILYDFAKDGLLNSNNKKAITSLANKGLLVDVGSVALINDSFRYFILEVLQPRQELKLGRELLEKGKWNTFRVVLFIVILALFILLWKGSNEIAREFKAILIALTSITTLLLKFRDQSGSFFGKR